MNWLKRLFGLPARRHGVEAVPPCPPDWHLTLDDLFAEMAAGKRKSVGNPEAEWARQYERSLLAKGSRFPRQGDLYESRGDRMVHYMTAWAAPFTGGGEALLLEGERVWVNSAVVDAQPLGTYALAVEYARLEQRMVPRAEREDPRYRGFYLYFTTADLNRDFTLIRTGFDGGDEQGAGDAAEAPAS